MADAPGVSGSRVSNILKSFLSQISGRRQKKKVMQMIIPLLFGMKSAGMAMFAMAIVTTLTLKAFFASKVALLVTVGMAVKKLYETYGSG